MATLRYFALGGAAALLAACAGQPPAAPSAAKSPWPSWVLQPESPGVAAAECVEASGNLSLDRTQAATAARVTLARNLEVNIQASDELVAAKTGAQATQSFRSSAKVLTDKALTNSRVTRLEEVEVGKGRWLCAEVSLDAAGTRSLVKEAVAATHTTASAEVEEMLLQQFRRRSVTAQVVQKNVQ
ncbi:MAG: hypothetical protein KF891_23490 [Rhizobacter sp.]|nr:hypothetical protein [Rhizobacter sp.]